MSALVKSDFHLLIIPDDEYTSLIQVTHCYMTVNTVNQRSLIQLIQLIQLI